MSGPFQSSGGGGGGISEEEVDGLIDAKITEYDSTVDTKVGNAIDAAKTEIDGDVDAKIAAVVGTAGAAFDTLGEIQTAIDGKVSKSGDTMTGALNIVTTGSGGLTVTRQVNTQFGAGVQLRQDSTSPEAADVPGVLQFAGRNTSAAYINYADVRGVILDPTAGSEDGEFQFTTYVAGVPAARMNVANGVYMPGATGGDQGANSLNVGSLFVNGVNANTAFSASAAQARAASATNVYLTPANLAQRGAFRATLSANQTGVADATPTKIAFNVETFDVGGWYDNATNYRFTPQSTVPVRLDVAAQMTGTISVGSPVSVNIYKNGAPVSVGMPTFAVTANENRCSAGLTDIPNGTTDYYEAYTYIDTSSGTGTIVSGSATTFFSGVQQ